MSSILQGRLPPLVPHIRIHTPVHQESHPVPTTRPNSSRQWRPILIFISIIHAMIKRRYNIDVVEGRKSSLPFDPPPCSSSRLDGEVLRRRWWRCARGGGVEMWTAVCLRQRGRGRWCPTAGRARRGRRCWIGDFWRGRCSRVHFVSSRCVVSQLLLSLVFALCFLATDADCTGSDRCSRGGEGV